MNKTHRILFKSLGIAVILVLAMTSLVFAIADPDSAPQVTAVYVYEDCLEDGDVGVLVDYFIDYETSGNPPTGETATESYMAIFIDTDGSTQLKSVAPYTFQDSGYGRGLIWIYFTAAEAVTIDSANELLYDIWLVGNPTLGWVPGPDPPKTIGNIDYWQPADSSTSTLVALRVLYYADVLELAWIPTIDMIEETALGSRLTTLGESYFMNVIPNLRSIAPSAFAAGTGGPTLEDLDYTTVFGATIANATGTLTAASPLTLTEGVNNVDIAALGTFTLELEQGTIGTATTDVCTVTGSPVDLVAGTNTITTTTAIGNIVVDVELVNTQTALTDTITGTGLDLSTLATTFGMTRSLLSGLVWLGITIIICAAVYRIDEKRRTYGEGGGGKVVLLVFDICIVGGAVLGLMPVLVAVLMFICFGAFTGFILFFRGANV